MNSTELPDLLLSADYKKVHSQMSEAFRNEVSLRQLRKLGKKFHRDVEAYIFQNKLPLAEGVMQYSWMDERQTKGLKAVFDVHATILGLQMFPLSKHPETDQIYTKTVFDLPFKDEWFVFWGGTNNLVNYHYDYENQRYAYDFIIMQGDSSYDGNPALNESYYAFGKAYLAPADGTVVAVENDVKDNEPVGKMNEDDLKGNYVIIDHGNSEYSYLVHFKHQSIQVKPGDQVKRGDLLGQVGNSGHSSEAHIHFHVADSPDPMTSKSIRIKFGEKAEMKQGDVVSNEKKPLE
ncbi:M23 family metallopeptidase [Ornithinibacillus gellani]|uniref:M23 family metallopeptidase n=1 Tax=Ornithinibacillus gellani TaxID=2293253 RepID=UPI000F4A78BF|nr:M23 family metallopeptidase [Ornithinibacillus gellani]TQS71157.1 M23 family metallopeptidase [Ornithinibacillus gellani]